MAVGTQPVTAAVFLFGAEKDGVEGLGRALEEHGVVKSASGVLSKLTRAGQEAVGSQFTAATHGLLDLDLDQLLAAGWRRFEDLTAAARRTVEAPGSQELVDLATHSISSKHSPEVEIFVNDVRVATVHFALALTFTVKGLVAAVERGQLVSLHAGVCDLVGSLAAEGRELVKREGHYELPLLVRLGDGIPLLWGTWGEPGHAPPPVELYAE